MFLKLILGFLFRKWFIKIHILILKILHTGDQPDAPDGRLGDLLNVVVFSISSAAGSLISGLQQCSGSWRASEGSLVRSGGSIPYEPAEFGPCVLLSNADIAKSVALLVGGLSAAGSEFFCFAEERKREPSKKRSGAREDWTLQDWKTGNFKSSRCKRRKSHSQV